MAKQQVDSLPHSWDIMHWPVGVFPRIGEETTDEHLSRVRQFVRRHQAELLACGALTRVGRFKVLLGAGYAAFLAKNISRVEGYEFTGKRADAA